MKMLPQTAPEVQQAFERGDFVTKETASTFNQISDDQALEHVNKSGKPQSQLEITGVLPPMSAPSCQKTPLAFAVSRGITHLSAISLPNLQMKELQ